VSIGIFIGSNSMGQPNHLVCPRAFHTCSSICFLILDEWGGFFLASKDSASSVLNKDPKSGWLEATALVALAPDRRENLRQYFIDTFVCNPDKPHFGFFTSWDDFLPEHRERKQVLRCQRIMMTSPLSMPANWLHMARSATCSDRPSSG
jgi:hypothetical protein